MKTIRVRVHVIGLVQGVFFRDSTRRRAASLGLTGWVRNAQDGSVWLEAQGMSDGVQQLVEWCRVGSPAARVDSVDAQEMSSLRDDDGTFEIRY
jgi:acylphosphatase